ncbi:MAG: hypothetical protein ACLRPZ_03880 [Coprococcus sp.]
MANIFDCENQEIKIGKTSITIKNRDTGKTKGIVKNITKFKDMQPNKQMQYFKKLKSLNIWGNKMVNMDNVIIQDGSIVLFRNMRTIDFYSKYGFIDNTEKEQFEEKEQFYNKLSDSEEVKVINCYY